MRKQYALLIFICFIGMHAFSMKMSVNTEIGCSIDGLVVSANTLNGILLDEKTREPIQYASIFYKNQQSTGTLSELDGRFSIRTLDHGERDTLVFRILGYKNKYLPVQNINTDFIEVLMAVQPVTLDEIAVVDDEYLKELLVKAVKHIPYNYPRRKHRLTGYFQELGITDGQYSHFLESYLTVENQDYKKKKYPVISVKTLDKKILVSDHKVKYHQVRRSDDKRSLVNTDEWYLGGSIHELLYGNFVYEKSLYGISGSISHKDFLSNVEDIDESESNSIFNMGFQYNGEDTLVMVGLSSSFVHGKFGEKTDVLTTQIVINTANYAIERVVMSPTEKWTDSGSSTNNRYQEIQYREVDGKYYPSLIVSKRGLNNNAEGHQEVSSIKFVVQEIQPSKKSFIDVKPTKYLKRGDKLVEKEYKYDGQFWDSYQIPMQLEASQLLKAQLSREMSLHDQFLQNQTRRK